MVSDTHDCSTVLHSVPYDGTPKREKAANDKAVALERARELDGLASRASR